MGGVSTRSGIPEGVYYSIHSHRRRPFGSRRITRRDSVSRVVIPCRTPPAPGLTALVSKGMLRRTLLSTSTSMAAGNEAVGIGRRARLAELPWRVAHPAADGDTLEVLALQSPVFRSDEHADVRPLGFTAHIRKAEPRQGFVCRGVAPLRLREFALQLGGMDSTDPVGVCYLGLRCAVFEDKLINFVRWLPRLRLRGWLGGRSSVPGTRPTAISSLSCSPFRRTSK